MSSKNLIRIIFILILFSQCKPSPKTQLEKWVGENDKADAVEMDQLAQIIFDQTYKSTEWNESGQLFIEYGGSTALTFSDNKTYLPMILLDLARKTYRTYAFGEKRGLNSLRVSLVKPLFVKDAPNAESEVQEFEIYRIKIDEDSIAGVQSDWGKDFPDSFMSDKNDMPNEELLKFLEIWQKKWKVELNEFSRIEVH